MPCRTCLKHRRGAHVYCTVCQNMHDQSVSVSICARMMRFDHVVRRCRSRHRGPPPTTLVGCSGICAFLVQPPPSIFSS